MRVAVVDVVMKHGAQKVLITGASRGLGAAFARSCAAAGMRIVIADINVEQGQKLAEDLAIEFEQRVHFQYIDVANNESVKHGVAEAVAWLGGLDGLVNNAAVTDSGGKLMHELCDKTWDTVMAVNVRGVWQMTLACAPFLKASGNGRVVNISSDTALWGAPKLLVYVASKGAVNAMTHSMARELGTDGITVNAIAPGLVLGESTAYVPQARHEQYMQGRAIKREQVPSDVCSAVLFLLTPEASFITGQILPVNGGFFMSN